ncbi:MAG: TIGR00296 family protein [archaeon]
MEKLTIDEGRMLVKLARDSIENSLHKKKEFEMRNVPESLMKNRGVFVTLYVDGELRSCVGYPKPVMRLLDATVRAAAAAAFNDSRFPSIKEKDLANLRVEVTVLTPPEEIKTKERKDMKKEVIIGRHGLIAEYGPFSGLLLPQVPVEEGWDAETFLGQTCWKAGLSPSDWLNSKVKFYRFEGQIFAELKNGQVAEKKLMLKSK